MRKLLLFNILFCFFNLFGQNKSDFDEVKLEVSKHFFTNPNYVLKKAQYLKKIAKNNKEKSIAYQYLGYIYDLTDKSDSARYYFYKRLELNKTYFKNTNLYFQSVIDYSNWGFNYVDSFELVKLLTENISSINSPKFNQEKGLMYMLLGDIMLRDGEFEKANNYFDKSFELIKGKFVKADYYMRKANVQNKKGNFVQSKQYLLKGLNSFQEKNIFTFPLYLQKLGEVNIYLKKFDEAEKNLKEGLVIQKKLNFNALNSESFLFLSYLSKAKSDFKLEKSYLDLALENNQGDLYVLKDIYISYKEYYSRFGDVDNEQKFITAFKKINDSISSIERAKLKTDIESRFLLNESQRELKLKENIIQKDARIKQQYFAGFILLIITSIIVIYFYKQKINSEKKNRINEQLLHEEQLNFMFESQKNEILKEKIKAKLEERSKLSLEIHDGIASQIGALKLLMSTNNEISKTSLDDMISKLDDLYQDTRKLSHELDPDTISDIEFTQLIDNLLSILEKAGIRTTKNIYITNRIQYLNESILINIYRILQELCNNIIKHAEANEVEIEILEEINKLVIIIKDNGKGLKSQEVLKGIGFKNIRKRINDLNGELININLKKGLGFKIEIPL